MSNLTDAMSGALEHLGRTFLLAYYLPAAIFLLVNVQVFAPIWISQPSLAGASQGSNVIAISSETEQLSEPANVEGQNVQQDSSEQPSFLSMLGNELPALLSALILPMLVGLVLVALNDALIIILEGRPRWLRHGLLARWQRRNEAQCRSLYGKLSELRIQYRRESHRLVQATSDEERLSVRQRLAGLAVQINEEHTRLEQMETKPRLPQDPIRVMPTTFGNMYAMSEEYAYDHYGADSVLFWPRLREQMLEHVEGHSERLTATKTLLDISLNLTFLALIIALEGIVTVILAQVRSQPTTIPLVVTVVAPLVALASYRSAIGRVAQLGELIKNSFDSYRHLVLNVFGLQQPKTLDTERFVWGQLAAFVLRGDPFYFPEQFTQAAGGNGSALQADDTEEQAS